MNQIEAHLKRHEAPDNSDGTLVTVVGAFIAAGAIIGSILLALYYFGLLV